MIMSSSAHLSPPGNLIRPKRLTMKISLFLFFCYGLLSLHVAHGNEDNRTTASRRLPTSKLLFANEGDETQRSNGLQDSDRGLGSTIFVPSNPKKTTNMKMNSMMSFKGMVYKGKGMMMGMGYKGMGKGKGKGHMYKGKGKGMSTPSPSRSPTPAPTGNTVPVTRRPTPAPSTSPTGLPSVSPSAQPSDVPTSTPSTNPTQVPSSNPTQFPTSSPSLPPTSFPTISPTRRPLLEITGRLFNTGVDDNGNLLTVGSFDPHYVIVESGTLAVKTLAYDRLEENSGSGWIWQTVNGAPTNIVRSFETTFSLSGYDPETAIITGEWTVDNVGLGISLNGQLLGVTTIGYADVDSFAVMSGFQNGINTLRFIVRDEGIAGGFRLDNMRLRAKRFAVKRNRVEDQQIHDEYY